jgi:HSP20 family protein
MALTPHDPFPDIAPVRQATEQFLGQSLPGANRTWLPVDVFETSVAVEIRAALPGIKPEDVDITISGDVLTLRGEFKVGAGREDGHYRRRELYFGTFERSLRLPERFEADKAEPVFESGILTITIPKSAKAEVTHIKAQAGPTRE